MNFEDFKNCMENEANFETFMKEVRDYSNELLDILGEKESPVVFPALVMAMAKVCYVLANEREKEFLEYMADAKQGMDSLSVDFVDQIRAKKNSH
jgi:hypothetical protein